MREIAQVRSVIDPGSRSWPLSTRRQRDDSRFDLLSRREREILALVAEGWSNGAIFEQLVIIRRVVERHIDSSFRNWGSASTSP